MGKVKVTINRAGVKALLKSGDMMSMVEGYGRQIAARAGDGYEYDTYTGQNRVNSSVFAATKDARSDNLKNNTLLKAMR